MDAEVSTHTFLTMIIEESVLFHVVWTNFLLLQLFLCGTHGIYIYITNLVCYTYFHWFFSPECQHIFRKQTGIYFSPQKRLKHGRQNITLHWINGIIRNNKCIFTKLNAVFILKTAAWTKKILQRLIPSQLPDRFNKLLCSTAVP